MDAVEHTESSVVATSGNLVVAIHDRQVRKAAMERMGDLLEEVLARQPEGVCLLWVSLTPRPSPERAEQRSRLAMLRRPGGGLLGVAFVAEAGSLGSGLKRSAAYDLRARLGPDLAERLAVFDSLSAGVAFLADRVRPAIAADALLADVRDLWQASHPKGATLPE